MKTPSDEDVRKCRTPDLQIYLDAVNERISTELRNRVAGEAYYKGWSECAAAYRLSAKDTKLDVEDFACLIETDPAEYFARIEAGNKQTKGEPA